MDSLNNLNNSSNKLVKTFNGTFYSVDLITGEFKITGKMPCQDEVYQFAIENSIKIDEKVFDLLYHLLTVNDIQQAIVRMKNFLSKVLSSEVNVYYFEEEGNFEMTSNTIKVNITSKNSGNLGHILINGPFSFNQVLGFLAFYDSFVSVIEGLIISHRIGELLKSSLDTIFFTLNARARLTENELKDMETIALKLSKELNIDEDTTLIALKSANVGLVGVRDEIFEMISQGNMSDEMLSEYFKHIDYGYEIMREIGIEKEIVDVCLFHHETIDGKGPKGLSGVEIPKLAMVVGISEELVILRKSFTDLRGKYPNKYLEIISNISDISCRPNRLRREKG